MSKAIQPTEVSGFDESNMQYMLSDCRLLVIILCIEFAQFGSGIKLLLVCGQRPVVTDPCT